MCFFINNSFLEEKSFLRASVGQSLRKVNFDRICQNLWLHRAESAFLGSVSCVGGGGEATQP